MLIAETNIIYNHDRWVRTINSGVRANAGSGRDVKRQSRFLRLFTTPSLVQNIDEPGEDPDLHLSRRSTVQQHGLNLSTRSFAAISIITHCTTASRYYHHNGAPAVATTRSGDDGHAPVECPHVVPPRSVGWDGAQVARALRAGQARLRIRRDQRLRRR